MDASGTQEIDPMRCTGNLSIGQKLLLSAAVIGAAAGFGSLGIFASFTNSTLVSNTPATGTVTTDLASVTLTTTASPSSLLDTDVTNGLQIPIDRCSVA